MARRLLPQAQVQQRTRHPCDRLLHRPTWNRLLHRPCCYADWQWCARPIHQWHIRNLLCYAHRCYCHWGHVYRCYVYRCLVILRAIFYRLYYTIHWWCRRPCLWRSWQHGCAVRCRCSAYLRWCGRERVVVTTFAKFIYLMCTILILKTHRRICITLLQSSSNRHERQTYGLEPGLCHGLSGHSTTQPFHLLSLSGVLGKVALQDKGASVL